MSRATAVRTRVDAILRQFAPPDRKAYKRFVAATGGDSLIGRPGATTRTDTLLNPQPLYIRQGGGEAGRGGETVVAGNRVTVAKELTLILSPTALNETELADKALQVVLKDDAGVEEVFRVVDFEPFGFSQTTVMFQVVLRSASR